MKLDVEQWKDFLVGDVFECTTTPNSVREDFSSGDTPYITRSAINNGCSDYINAPADYITKGNCITIGAEGTYAFYQPNDFATGIKIYCLRNSNLNELNAMFICTLLNQGAYKYNYGRARILDKIKEETIKLPVTGNGTPDWQFMEDYIKSLNYKPVTTKNARRCSSYKLDTDKWKAFQVKDLFDVEYGINMELNACVLADDEEDAINFVARTEENNGVSAKVKRVEGKVPQEAGIITCAGGGSVLSTFLQEAPFYSGRDLYLLKEKEPISRLAKLFFITVLKANKYRYSYGRQANKTLPYIEVKLPATSTGSPDWAFMENYMKALPYGDKI